MADSVLDTSSHTALALVPLHREIAVRPRGVWFPCFDLEDHSTSFIEDIERELEVRSAVEEGHPGERALPKPSAVAQCRRDYRRLTRKSSNGDIGLGWGP